MRDIVGEMCDYENGKLNEKETCDLFQHLLDSGMIYSLQGTYQRIAETLLDAGKIELPKHRF